MLSSAVLVLAASGLGYALPAPKAASNSVATSGGKFSVPAIPNAGFVPNGPAAYRKALLKYGKEVPAALERAVISKRQDGSVSASPADQDVQYTCPVNIGGQTLNLDFDTGSADLWVFSTELSSSDQSGHNIFDPSQSSTFQTLDGASWQISYGDGSSASGDVGTDTVTVGGTVVNSQAVELANTVASSFVSDTASDGLLGLAFSSINTVSPTQQKTFLENAAPSLDKGLVCANLLHNQVGSYDFGFLDSSSYTGSVKYTAVDSSNGFWEFAAGSGKTAIADTGTTLLLMSSTIVKAYYKKVSGSKNDSTQGGYTVPCNGNLPDLTITVGTQTATVSGASIAYAPISDGSSTCFGGLQSITGNQFIYGDIFLKNVYAVFDLDNTQFGFANKS